MQASTVKIQELFQSNTVLKIPYFQRSYVWVEENWERFFYDIIELPQTGTNYFLGSVILKKAGTNQLGYEQYDVVDGQQRLTTLVIFSKLLYMLAGKNDKFNNTFIQDDVDEPVLRANRKDSSVFNSIVQMLNFTDTVTGEGQVKKAYDYFLKKCTSEIRDNANTIIRFMNNNVTLVRIIVDNQENEQQIFDTINSLGQGLTTGEMLKNHLFNDTNIDLYDEKWLPTFEQFGGDYNYWNESLTKGRLKANNIETFFYYFMQIKMQEPSLRTSLTAQERKQYRKQDGLYGSYKDLIAKHNLNKNSLIEEIVDYASLYRNNFNQDILLDAIEKYPCVERLSFMMFAQGTWTPVPYILYVLKNVSDLNERVRIFEYLETYLLRRIVCKSKNNNYSDLFSENLIGQGVSTCVDFKAYVNDSSSRGALLIPSDSDVMDSVCNIDLRKEAALILYMIESKLNNQFTADLLNNGFKALDVEPIMPIKYSTTNWPLTDGFTEDERNSLMRTLGNYLLVRGSKLAAKKSGTPWSIKKTILSSLVDGLQTSQIVTVAEFDENVIKKRNKFFAERICELWKA